MNKLCWLLLFALATGAVQFGTLVGLSSPPRDWALIVAGVIAAIGGGVLSHLHPLPKVRWSEEKRAAKQGVTEAKAAVEALAESEGAR